MHKPFRIWDPSTGDCLRTLTGHSDGVTSLAFLPNGTLASGSGSDDKTIKIWDPSTGDCLRTLTGHSDWVTSLAFLPNENFISGSDLITKPLRYKIYSRNSL